MLLLFIALLLLNTMNCFAFKPKFHLNSEQIKTVNHLIQNPGLTDYQRNKINYILYCSYEKWAVKIAKKFMYLHRNKCLNISKDDIILSSKIGLFKSIQKYNGKHSLTNYSYFYVKSELMKIITEKYAMSSVSKKVRMQNKQYFSKEEIEKYNKELSTPIIEYKNSWLFNDIYFSKNSGNPNSFETYSELWDKINQLTPFEQRIIKMKYTYDFQPLLTNKNVAELMCCSEETIRTKLIKIREDLRKIM